MQPAPWSLHISLDSAPVGLFTLSHGLHTLSRDPEASIFLPNLPSNLPSITFLLEDQFITFTPEQETHRLPSEDATASLPSHRSAIPQTFRVGPLELLFTPTPIQPNQSDHIAITIPATRPLSPQPSTKPSPISDLAITIPAGKLTTPKSAAESAANAPTIVPTASSRGFIPLTPSPKRPTEKQTLTAENDYVIEREIARGGMGVIYEGADPILQRSVAVKVSSLAGHNGDPRFKQEAEVLAALAHPNIVPIHTFGTDANGSPFYSMKLIKGRTLQSIIDSLRTDPEKASAEYPLAKRLSIFRKACDALSFAHDQGFIHRDIKPDNIMVGEYGEVLVMDWGLAKRIGAAELPSGPSTQSGPRDASSSSLGMTLEGDVIGTPQYMAPEQAEGRIADLDERSDLYSLGGILFALLTLRPPIEGTSVDEVLGNVKSGRISSLTTRKSKATTSAQTKLRPLDHTIPEALRAITLKALAFRPEDRYASVEALAADVDAFQNGFATQAEHAGFFRRTALLIKRHKAISALLFLLLVGGVTFTLRLAASERHAIAEHAQALRASADATIALAEVAEERLEGERMEDLLEKIPKNLRSQTWDYLWNRLNPALLETKSDSVARWVFTQPHPTQPGVFLALQSHGILSQIDSESQKTTVLFDWKIANKNANGLCISKDGQLIALAKTHQKSGISGTDILILDANELSLKHPVAQLTIPFPIGPFSGPKFGMHFSKDKRLLFVSSSQRLRETNKFVIQAYAIPNGEMKWSLDHDYPSLLDCTPKGTLYAVTDKEGVREIKPESGIATKILNEPLFPGMVGNRSLLTADPEWERIYTLKSANIIRAVALKDGSPLLILPIGSEISQLQSIAVDRRGHLWTARRMTRQSSALESWDREGKPEMGFPLLSGKQGSWQIIPHPLSDHLCLVKDSDLEVIKLGDSPNLATATQKSALHINAIVKASASEPICYITSRDSHLFLRTETREATQPIHEIPLPDLSSDQTRRTALLPSQHNATLHLIQDTDQRPKVLVIQYSMNNGTPVEESRNTTLFPAWWSKAITVSPDGKHAWTGESVVNLATQEIESKLDLGNLRFEGDSPERIASIAAWTGTSQVVQIMSVFETEDPEDEGWHDVIAAIELPSGKIRKMESAPSAASLAASPDGKHIAEAGFDRRIRIRDSETLEVVREFLVHESRIRKVIWHPTRPLLITQGDDRRTKIIHADSGQILEEIWSGSRFFSNVKLASDGASVLLSAPLSILTWEPKSLKPQ